jgi:hypothetical protein
MKKQDLKIIKDIQMDAAKKFGDKLWVERPKADIMLEVIEKALTVDRDKFDSLSLEKMEAIKQSKMLEGMERVIDQDVLLQMDEYMGELITKAIEEKRLSHPDKDPFIKKLKQAQRRYEAKEKLKAKIK